MSQYLCSIPFVHLSSHPTGTLRPCCFSSENVIRDDNGKKFNLKDSTVDEVWNSSHYRDLRMRMLSGEKVPECTLCWKEEDVGRDSKRIRENRKYIEALKPNLKTIKANEGRVDSFPGYLDLRLGNLCNLKCRSCNGSFSNTIQNEVDRHWDKDSEFYEFFDGRKNDATDWYQSDEFWKQIFDKIETLDHVYLTGGEPLLISQFYEFLDRAIETKASERMTLRINTNLTILKPKFLEAIPYFKKVIIGASIDATHDKLRFMRHPANWDKISSHINTLSKLGSNVYFYINTTVSVFNIYYLDQIVEDIRKATVKGRVHFYFDIAHEPNFINCDVLPDHLKEDAVNKLSVLKETFEGREKQDIEGLKKLININDNLDKKRSVFKNYTNFLDSIRKENFKETFPELASLVQ